MSDESGRRGRSFDFRSAAARLASAAVVVALGFALTIVSVITVFNFAVRTNRQFASNVFQRHLVTMGCAGFRTRPPAQAGVGWYLPIVAFGTNSVPPFGWAMADSVMLCGFVPWSPQWPDYGAFVFP